LDSITTIFVTLITVLGSSAAWDYYKNKLKVNEEEEKGQKADKNLYRDDLKIRVSKLEDLLGISDNEKNVLRDRVTELTREVAILTTKVEYLSKEVDKLEQENKKLQS
jgi:hypothetical protein